MSNLGHTTAAFILHKFHCISISIESQTIIKVKNNYKNSVDIERINRIKYSYIELLVTMLKVS